MATTSTTDATAHVPGLVLAYALFGGILAWLLHLMAMTGLNGWACRSGQLWPMHAVTVATLAVTLHALWISWRTSRATASAPSVQAARFLGFAGVVVNTFNAVLIVAEWVPVVFIHPCATG